MKKSIWILVVLTCLLGAGAGGADDTDILGATSTAVQPNVMIIFDTSGSMATRDIPTAPYDPHLDYTGRGGGYEKDAIYVWTNESGDGRWSKLMDWQSLDQTCTSSRIDEDLRANGQAWARINFQSPHDCGGKYDELDLRMGNFLNYENGGRSGQTRSRLEVAKEVVKQLIDDHPNVRFGLMRFSEGPSWETNDTAGGRISDHGDINTHPTAAELKSDVDAFSAESYTPLAESLAEAGLYFAGQRSWFNSVTYTSPIDIECRPNYIILMTDGDSTKDQDPRLNRENAYIHNGTIGDYDRDGNEETAYDNGGSDYLDDVAAFLFENDLMPKMGTGDPLYEKQFIITHTIGFRNTHRLLRDTAESGGGKYFTAGSRSALARAFKKILGAVESERQVFVAPKVPVSRANGVYAGDRLYMGLFKADMNSGLWRGNLKKYKLDSTGHLIDINNARATDSEGMLLTTAHSYWSEQVDGPQVDEGGAGARLIDRPSRNLYSYHGGVEKDLTADINAFSISNRENISIVDLGVVNDEERQAVINDLHGGGKEWVMADVLHSEPVAVSYDTNGDGSIDNEDDALIFVGTNGGVMHAFLDSSGEELWGFIPPQQLGRLKRLMDADNAHDYFLDGPPEVIGFGAGDARRKALVFGERRGGTHYYALDITVHDEPIWMYHIGEDYLGEGAELLGQSWGRPQSATLGTRSDGIEEVLLLPGGYDVNQDYTAPTIADQKGRAVFSVAVQSGEPGGFRFYNDDDNADMTHCIVDLVGVDPDGDGITNSIYAPDLGGNLFAFSDSDADGSWEKLRLFDASSDGTQRKIFHSPDVIRILGDPEPGDDDEAETIGEMVYFGTGDRAHPEEAVINNRFYAVKNYGWEPEGFVTLTDRIGMDGEGDLHDATQNLKVQGTEQQKAVANEEIKKRMGWFVELEGKGEKVVSSPVVFNRTVYFTTYVPPSPVDATEEIGCAPDNIRAGEARLYGLDYKDGRAVHDDWSGVKEYDPESGEEIESGGKADRYLVIGRSMPSAPMVAIRNGVAKLYVGVGGELIAIEPKKAVEMNMYYWHEIKP